MVLVVSPQLRNTIHLSICFTFIFIAMNGLGNIQKTLLNSIKLENPDFDGDGYLSHGIMYTAMGISTWCAPSVIAKIGIKFCLIIGTIIYGIYISIHLTEIGYLIYIGSALMGFGGSLLWTAQANYIVSNCNIGEVAKGIGIFWMIYQTSHIPGNLFIYFKFHNVQHIDGGTRCSILIVLLCVHLMALIMLFFLQPPIRTDIIQTSKEASTAFEEFQKALDFSKSDRILLLFSTMAYTGLHLTYVNVLSASIGFSSYLSFNSTELVPLCGIFHGIGSTTGGLVPQYFNGRKTKYWRPIFTVAIVANSVTYIIAYLTLPNAATFGYTKELPLISTSPVYLLFASFLAGVGDCCLHTQIYSELGTLYPHDSAPVFAVFKFFRSIFSATSFYYSNYFGLHIQIIILTIWLFISFITYHLTVLVSIQS